MCDQWFPVMLVSLVLLKHVEEMLRLNVSFVNNVELLSEFISDMRQFSLGIPDSSINKTESRNWNIVKSGVKYHNRNP